MPSQLCSCLGVLRRKRWHSRMQGKRKAGTGLQPSEERPSWPQSIPQLVQHIMESSGQLPKLLLTGEEQQTVSINQELFPQLLSS